MPFLGNKPTEVASPVDINSGTIDGTTIGGGSASPATVTTFTSTGIDDNADATAITINSSEQVGIGTASPAHELHIAGTEPNIRLESGGTPSALYGLEITNGSTVDGYFRTRGGTGETQIGSGRSAGWGGHLTFYTDTAERMRVLSSGGLAFNGDTAAANALDDYEEGTWTVTLTNRSGSAPTASLGNATGYYVKVGKMVHATWYSAAMSISATNGTSAQISGLPYTIENLNNHYPVATFAHANCFSSQIQNGMGFYNTANFSPNVEGSTPNPNWVTGSGLYLACSIVYRAA